MENKLKKLFEYQRFENSPKLSKLIAETENRYSLRLLSDEETEMVSAAGDYSAEEKELRHSRIQSVLDSKT